MSQICPYKVPLSASVLFPLLHGAMPGRWLGVLILCAASAAIVMRHMENLRRIRNGTELRFSFLWNRESELEKVRVQMEQAGMDMSCAELPQSK